MFATAVAVTATVVIMVTVAVVAVVRVVVMAFHCRIIGQLSGQKIGHRLVGGARDTAIELNTGLSQGSSGPTANSAANQRVHTALCQQTGQSAVAAPVGTENGR